MKNGQRVKRINTNSTYGGPEIGATGIIVDARSSDYGVQFDKRWDIERGHSCNDKCPTGYGYYLQESELEVFEQKFSVGDKVKAIDEDGGWGSIKKGDIGIIKNFYESSGRYYVDFPNQFGWVGRAECFELVTADTADTTDTSSKVAGRIYSQGDKLIPNQSLQNCCSFNWVNTEYIEITDCGKNSNGEPYYSYRGYNSNDEQTDSCCGHEECFLEGMEYYTTNVSVNTPKAVETVMPRSFGNTEAIIPKPTVEIASLDTTDTLDTYTPIYKTNIKYKPRAANIRKLMGLRNHKGRVAASA